MISPDSIQDSGVMVYDYITQPKTKANLNKLKDPEFDAKNLSGKTIILKDDVDKAKTFPEKAQISFPVAYDYTLELHDSLSVAVYPTTFLLKKNHKVISKISGFGSAQGSHQRLKQALRKHIGI